jgi:hypothetical protein
MREDAYGPPDSYLRKDEPLVQVVYVINTDTAKARDRMRSEPLV